MGTFKCRTTTERAPRSAHASRPPSRAAFPPAPTSCLIFLGFQSHFAASCAKPTAPAHLDENATHGTHFHVTAFADRPLKKLQLIFGRAALCGSRGLWFSVERLSSSIESAKKHTEKGDARSRQMGRWIRLLATRPYITGWPLAVAVRPRTERGQNDSPSQRLASFARFCWWRLQELAALTFTESQSHDAK